MPQSDKGYNGSILASCDRYLGPRLFEPYAEDLAARARAIAPFAVLETAAGTGIRTRQLASALADDASVTAFKFPTFHVPPRRVRMPRRPDARCMAASP